jgi:hypothetical protein
MFMIKPTCPLAYSESLTFLICRTAYATKFPYVPLTTSQDIVRLNVVGFVALDHTRRDGTVIMAKVIALDKV